MRAAVDTDPRPPGGCWSDEQLGEDDVAAAVAGDGPLLTTALRMPAKTKRKAAISENSALAHPGSINGGAPACRQRDLYDPSHPCPCRGQ
jgi:hypothetical protein